MSGQEWKRSTRCSSGACVEVALCGCPQPVSVRDGKDPAGPVLTFDAQSWRDFLAGLTDGEMRTG